MGEHIIKLPDVGEGVAEAELVEWHVKIGDMVREDTVLAAVMTDKATVEIPSPVDGEILWLGAEIGDTVAIGSPIVRLKVAGEGNVVADTKSPEVTAASTPTPNPSPQGGGGGATASKGGAKPTSSSSANSKGIEGGEAAATESPSPLWGGARGGGPSSSEFLFDRQNRGCRLMFRLEARTSTPAWFNLALPLLAIGGTLILCSGLIALAGAGVLEAYGVMFTASLGDSYAITETMVRATPMIFTGLAVAVAFRAKFWNIGAEGQLLAGAVASCFVGAIPMPG
ncbi:biotin/lipoyl-containing protein, partial [Mesorhizobium sp. M7A.F.Ca.CA.004.11.2.1]|uniref:biotin/lipoyl-containing protein n=1 Tax=Mesorhizobium sp. M7A.F.Ca.CA.004.11.2.1 TaxID=2496699 RepID=UPI0032AFDAC1